MADHSCPKYVLIEKKCAKETDHKFLKYDLPTTISASMQRQGSIFQNGFLDGKSLKKWTFKQENPPKDVF